MCNISVCQDTGEENGKLLVALSPGGLPSRVCEWPMTILRAEDTIVKRIYSQSFRSSSQDGNHIYFPSSFFPFSSTSRLRLVFSFLPSPLPFAHLCITDKIWEWEWCWQSLLMCSHNTVNVREYQIIIIINRPILQWQMKASQHTV